MTKKILLTTILAISASLTANISFAGPFGTEMGMTAEQLGITSSTKVLSPHLYQLQKLPKMSSMFEYYLVTVTPQSGLCGIRAVGNDITTSVYGEGLKRQFDSLYKAVEKKYGKGTRADFLKSGSIWYELNEWTMGLYKNERVLAGYFDEEEGSTMVENVTQAWISATALHTDKGYLRIDYKYSNAPACESEIQSLQEDVF